MEIRNAAGFLRKKRRFYFEPREKFKIYFLRLEKEINFPLFGKKTLIRYHRSLLKLGILRETTENEDLYQSTFNFLLEEVTRFSLSRTDFYLSTLT